MHVGSSCGATADIDALTAFQFFAIWANNEVNVNKIYSKYAAFRLSQLKLPLSELEEFRRTLEEYFLKLSES